MGRLTSIKSRLSVADTRTTKLSPAGEVTEATRGAAPWAKRTDHGRLTGRPWRRKREQILERDLYLCQCPDCAKRAMPLQADEVDHIIPLAEGGTDDDSNLQSLNCECHKLKTQAESARAQGHAPTRGRRAGGE